uniref:Uncharacterized protein n=1 Tax=Anguilla anguilla TaxID=7936 RepID=A0A0E9W6B1_ANGAN
MSSVLVRLLLLTDCNVLSTSRPFTPGHMLFKGPIFLFFSHYCSIYLLFFSKFCSSDILLTDILTTEQTHLQR